MKNNGFTLIELLAVIVILAIIALIATPIILGIINDAREKANERSVELYAAAVKNGIAAYQLTGLNAPKSFSDLSIQYDGDVKCTVQELYEDGSFYLEGCKVNNGTKEYSYGTKQVKKGKMSSVCNPISVATEGAYTAGDKYECDVDPSKKGYDYIFYVLNSDATNVNLIMDSNINIGGNAVKGEESDLGFVLWYEDYNDNSHGPLTAMNYLQTATAGWTNVNEQTINTFTGCDGWECIDKTMIEYTVNARMPYLSEISRYDGLSGANAYLYDNLHANCWDDNYNSVSCDEATEKYGVFAEGIEQMEEVEAYWTLSSYTEMPGGAWSVAFVGSDDYTYSDYVGVRPVINLSI